MQVFPGEYLYNKDDDDHHDTSIATAAATTTAAAAVAVITTAAAAAAAAATTATTTTKGTFVWRLSSHKRSRFTLGFQPPHIANRDGDLFVPQRDSLFSSLALPHLFGPLSPTPPAHAVGYSLFKGPDHLKICFILCAGLA